jgi:NTP pyrophosphatase (non-canonical NTP hydrolase)
MKNENNEEIGLNEIAALVHENAVEKGFWENDDYQQKISLITSEIGEVVDARREMSFTDYSKYELFDGSFIEAFEKHVKGTYQDEVADVYLRTLDLCGELLIDVEKRDGITLVDTDDIYGNLNLISLCLGKASEYQTVHGDMKNPAVSIQLVKVLMIIERLADISGVSLGLHCTNKMAYNRQRAYKHGKLF